VPCLPPGFIGMITLSPEVVGEPASARVLSGATTRTWPVTNVTPSVKVSTTWVGAVNTIVPWAGVDETRIACALAGVARPKPPTNAPISIASRAAHRRPVIITPAIMPTPPGTSPGGPRFDRVGSCGCHGTAGVAGDPPDHRRLSHGQQVYGDPG